MDPTQTDIISTVIARRLLYDHFLLIMLAKPTHLDAWSAEALTHGFGTDSSGYIRTSI